MTVFLRPPTFLAAALAASLAVSLGAQSASSSTCFLADGEIGAGGSCQSIVHQLTGTQSAGVPAALSMSTSFVLLGGFPAALDAPVAGRPWLTGVTPMYVPLLGGTPLVLHGTELNLGPMPAVRVGGVAAAAGVRTNATLQATLPPQPEPGYCPVEVQSPLGTATLPHGLGVLPLIDFPVAHQAFVPFDLRYLGAQGDQVVLVVALGKSPFPFRLPGFHHGLELHLGSLVVLPAFAVTAPSGELRVKLPAVAPAAPIWFQMFSLTQNPGWFPGSFTNAVRI